MKNYQLRCRGAPIECGAAMRQKTVAAADEALVDLPVEGFRLQVPVFGVGV